MSLEEALECGDALEEAGDLTGAIAAFEKAASMHPLASEPWISLGLVAQEVGMSTGDFDKAADSFAAACERADPSDPEPQQLLAVALYLGGRFTEATSAHDAAISTLVANGAAAMEVADALVRRATSARFAANTEEDGLASALADYDRALIICPGHQSAKSERAAVVAMAFWQTVHVKGQNTARHEILSPYHTHTLSPSTTPLHSGHLIHFASDADCRELIAAAEASGRWNAGRHSDFATYDIEVSTVPALVDWVVPRLHTTLLPTMAALFELSVSRLVTREIFIVKYSADGQPELQEHRDKCLLSFNILLSDPSDFEGGGTHLTALGKTVHLRETGDVFMHCGQMLHGGAKVTRGTRYIIVAFVEVTGSCIEEEVSDSDDNDVLQTCWSALQGIDNQS